MAIHNEKFRIFVAKAWTTYALIVANIVLFGICIYSNHTIAPKPATLLQFGALYKNAIKDEHYWRLGAAGFLHANIPHLIVNMLCLVIWGSLLEKRIGAFFFIVVYAASLLGGSILSVLTQPGAFVGVGASGAIAGVFGALVALYILGKIQLSAGFIVANLAINVVLAMKTPAIDWRAHLGGFTAGLIVCALLNSVARPAAGLLLRSKFPEFVKINGIGLVIFYALWAHMEGFGVGLRQSDLTDTLAACVAGLLIVKALDLWLQVKRGLFYLCIFFAVVDATLPLVLSAWLRKKMSLACHITSHMRLTDALHASFLCDRPVLDIVVLSSTIVVAVLLIYRHHITRGWQDVGFVAATFAADRKRSAGL